MTFKRTAAESERLKPQSYFISPGIYRLGDRLDPEWKEVASGHPTAVVQRPPETLIKGVVTGPSQATTEGAPTQ